MIREITIPTTKDTFLSDYLLSINGILNLTDKEKFVLEKMLLLNDTVTATKEQRKQLVELTGVKDVPALNNVIKALADKNILLPNPQGRGYVYNKLVKPTSDTVKVKFAFN